MIMFGFVTFCFNCNNKSYNMMFKLVVCLLVAVSCKITIDRGLESTQITLTDIQSFSEVLVEAQFNYVDSDRYEKMHLAVRSANKHKKQAYMDLMKKFNGVVRTLMKLKAIPNKQAMIQSIVHRNFLRKSRKWQFSRYFVLYALKQDIPKITRSLQVFRPEVVKTAPIIHYLDEKFMSIAAFIQAKLELQKFIKQHLNSQYKILLTKDIQIIGNKVDNEQIIEDHIEQQFNKNKLVVESASEEASAATDADGYYIATTKGRKYSKKLIMKVLFQLVEKTADLQDILEQIQQGEVESHSISDFEDQMLNQEWKSIEKQDESDFKDNQNEENNDLGDDL